MQTLKADLQAAVDALGGKHKIDLKWDEKRNCYVSNSALRLGKELNQPFLDNRPEDH